MVVDISNECVFQNMLDTNVNKNMEQKCFLQLRKVLFNDAVNKEKIDFLIQLYRISLLFYKSLS